MLSRRDLVGKLAVGAAGVALVASGTRVRAAVDSGADHAGSAPEDPGMEKELREAAEAAGRELREAAEAALAPAEEVAVGIVQGPPPWELLAPLKLGSSVAYGWHVADLTGPVNGACVLTLQNERGRVQRVHLCRNDGTPQGFVYTRRLDLVVMNGGRGDLGTEENLAQAVAAIAHVIAANEDRNAAAIDALLPHAERVSQYSSANEWTLR